MNEQLFIKKSHRTMISLVIVVILVMSSLVYYMGDAVATVGIDTTKVDQALQNELSLDSGLLYYDTIIVFEDKVHTSLLDVFARQIKTFEVLPMARVLLNKNEIAEVSQWTEVLFIEPNKMLQTFNSEGRVLTRSEDVQASLGFDGSNVEVAVVDTGADGTHPDLINMQYNWQIVGNLIGDEVFVSATPDGINVETVFVDVQQETGVPINTDEYGHGTHVFGTIAGTGDGSEGHYRGMAPNAKVHSYSASAGILLIYTLEAYDHIMSQNINGNADIRLINNSWGSEGCEFVPLQSTNVATRLAYEMGILSVFAYGNSGPGSNTCNPYATAPYVLGVAATDKAYKVTGFSSRGKVDANYDREAALDNLYQFLASSRNVQQSWDYVAKPVGVFRPSVAAPGQDIISAQSPVHPMTTSGTNYGSASGTSMAAPHVTGVMVLVVDAFKANHPNELITPIDLIRIAEVTANKEIMNGYDTLDTGAGFVDAMAAVQRAVSNDIPYAVTASDLVVFTPLPVTSEGGDYSGTALANSFQTDIGYGVHEVEVREGAFKIYADVSWASDVEKVYISLYAPGLNVATDEPTASSAGLLDITNHRFVEYNFPEAGVWKVRIDGRVNLATSYNGKWEVQYPVNTNTAPTGTLQVTPEKVAGNESIDIAASIVDLDGIADLTNVQLVVRAGNGRVLYNWYKEDFNLVDDTTLQFNSSDVKLSGKAPWTVTLSAEDASGQKVFKQAFIGKK